MKSKAKMILCKVEGEAGGQIFFIKSYILYKFHLHPNVVTSFMNSATVYETQPDSLLETLSSADSKIRNLEQSLDQFSGGHDQRTGDKEQFMNNWSPSSPAAKES